MAAAGVDIGRPVNGEAIFFGMLRVLGGVGPSKVLKRWERRFSGGLVGFRESFEAASPVRVGLGTFGGSDGAEKLATGRLRGGVGSIGEVQEISLPGRGNGRGPRVRAGDSLLSGLRFPEDVTHADWVVLRGVIELE